jgi:hypothetical protein
MKTVLGVFSLFFALSAFSQSYLILNNGITLTIDKGGFVYDLGHFSQVFKVSAAGARFFVEDGKLHTVDENGYLYEKDKVKVSAKGGNYFFDESFRLHTIDARGFVYKFEDKLLKKAKGFGGNYFTVRPDDRKPAILYTVNSLGNYFQLNIPGLSVADIKVFGGNYFQMKDGTVYTVSKDGFVFSKDKTPEIKKLGGNFFIDASGVLYTIAEDGVLLAPALPSELSVSAPFKLGANYMIDGTGKMFTVDQSGSVFLRSVSHDLSKTKIFSF